MATNGLVVMTPTSIAYSGTSASINSDGSVAFSAVTSLSLNGVFTSDYDNYQISLQTKNSSMGDCQFRLRASGTDATGSNYTWQFIRANSTTVSGARATSQTEGYVMSFSGTTYTDGFALYLFGPYLPQPTASRSVSAYAGYASSGADIYDFATTHSLSTSYDGITIIPAGGNFSGLLTVFGFAQ